MDMIIRLFLGFLAGAIIGFERASRHQVAGMRTHVLIATGATLLMLLSIWLPQEFAEMKNGDPGRIAAQVVSGIGFLGAGAMIRLGNNIKGLTTAASLWLTAAMGLAIGGGMFLAAGMALSISLVTLLILGRFEHRFFPQERNKLLELSLEAPSDTKEALEILTSFAVRGITMDMDHKDKNQGARLHLLVGIPSTTDIAKLVKTLKASGKVKRISMRENY
jgi:putative Mg2+ transporter-C (MgtC) family protein